MGLVACERVAKVNLVAVSPRSPSTSSAARVL